MENYTNIAVKLCRRWKGATIYTYLTSLAIAEVIATDEKIDDLFVSVCLRLAHQIIYDEPSVTYLDILGRGNICMPHCLPLERRLKTKLVTASESLRGDTRLYDIPNIPFWWKQKKVIQLLKSEEFNKHDGKGRAKLLSSL